MEAEMVVNKTIFAKSILVFIFLVFLSLSLSTAQSIELKINNLDFKSSDQVIIYLELSGFSQNTALYVKYALGKTDKTYSGLAETKEINVNSSKKETFLLYNLSVNEYYPDGEYYVKASISDARDLNYYKEIYFTINKSEIPSLLLEPLFCKDNECKEESVVFEKGGEVFIKADSLPETIVYAEIIFPNKETKKITIPTSIAPDQVGIYNIEFVAEKQGYSKIKVTKSFVVLEKSPEFKAETICNANNKCEKKQGENTQTCPLDCNKKEENNIFKYLIFMLILAGILICAILAIRTRKKRRRR